MPELIEQMYCSQQIVIPPKFPYILKKYAKAAIKTQPYDLLRWSYEYFKAIAENRTPPVKFRLEYPVYSTEGGLSRGYLKVLANQVEGMDNVPLPFLKAIWLGSCLDVNELHRILCLCEVYLREEAVPKLHFLAVAGGLLTKSLTHTMLLLCETLTKEPDGGSAAIPVDTFLLMYRFLASMDASKDTKYINGYREGIEPEVSVCAEEEEAEAEIEEIQEPESEDDFWANKNDLLKLDLTNDHVDRSTHLSLKMNMPTIGKIERSPSVERAGQIERENYMRERKGRAEQSEEVEEKLRELSGSKLPDDDAKRDQKDEKKPDVKTSDKKPTNLIEIFVTDEDDNPVPYAFYGEPKSRVHLASSQMLQEETTEEEENENAAADEVIESEADKIAAFVAESYRARAERLLDLEHTMDQIAALVNRYKSAFYDLGMVAGRQMSTTSGEFIVQHIEKEIMDYIDEQIAVLPDPDLKKKKAKPEEVAMIRDLLETFLDENMDIIVPETEEVEEEEQPIPVITTVYAVPGIGPPVSDDIVKDFIDYALEACKCQGDVFMPRNIRHFLCPPLEKFAEHIYEEPKGEEACPAGGTITD